MNTAPPNPNDERFANAIASSSLPTVTTAATGPNISSSKAANSCVADLKLSMPLLVDDMKNTVGDAFQGHPDRLFILTPEGKIAFRGERGPRGFNVAEMCSALETLLSPAAKQE